MQFPLYHRPSAVVFLDDDTGYLDMLADVMPHHWSVRLFTHASDCIHHLKQQQTEWENDVDAHLHMTASWGTGTALVPQLLAYWQTHSQRYALTNVLIVDYSMPAMTGLDVLKALPKWPAQRILLTGQADESMAVNLFNQRLINQFIPKQHPLIGQHLAHAVQELNALPLLLHDSIWRNALKKGQLASLQADSVQSALAAFVRERGWVEYCVLAEPFGILGIDAQAVPQWLQLEHIQDLPDAAELAETAGQPNAVTTKIRQGTHLTNAELLMALGSEAPLAIASTISIGFPGGLLGAFFNLPGTGSAGRSYNEFHGALASRSVQSQP